MTIRSAACCSQRNRSIVVSVTLCVLGLCSLAQPAGMSAFDVTGQVFRAAEGTRPDLKGRNLAGLDLSNLNVRKADLSHSNLFGADLSGADVACTDVTGAGFNGTILKDAKGLETLKGLSSARNAEKMIR